MSFCEEKGAKANVEGKGGIREPHFRISFSGQDDDICMLHMFLGCSGHQAYEAVVRCLIKFGRCDSTVASPVYGLNCN